MRKYAYAAAMSVALAGPALAAPSMETFGAFTVIGVGDKLEVINTSTTTPSKVSVVSLPAGFVAQEISGTFPYIVVRNINHLIVVNFSTIPATVSSPVPIP